MATCPYPVLLYLTRRILLVVVAGADVRCPRIGTAAINDVMPCIVHLKPGEDIVNARRSEGVQVVVTNRHGVPNMEIHSIGEIDGLPLEAVELLPAVVPCPAWYKPYKKMARTMARRIADNLLPLFLEDRRRRRIYWDSPVFFSSRSANSA
jgi:hypothetical protein